MFFGLEPTNDNIFKTLKEDTLKRNAYISWLIRLISSMGGSRTIAIDGDWGSGKTFFVKQSKMVIDAFNVTTSAPEIFYDEYSEDCPVKNEDFHKLITGEFKSLKNCDMLESCSAIYYDAWSHDDENDPIASIVLEIISDPCYKEQFQAKTDLIELATDVMDAVTQRSISTVVRDLREKKELKEIIERIDYKKTINSFFDRVTDEKCNRLIIFIDELDRCNPEFAVRLLERIKHYCNHDRINFVFSINQAQLEQTLKRFYGNDFEAGKYLNKFFDLPFPIPPANMDGFYRSIGFTNSSCYFDIVIKEVGQFFSFGLREFCKLHLLAKTAIYNETAGNDHWVSFDDENARWFILHIIVPFALGLHLKNGEQYNQFIRGEDDSLLEEFIKSSSIIRKCLLTKCAENEDGLTDNIHKAYNAIFKNSDGTTTKVGGMEFDRYSKETVLDRVSILSDRMYLD